MALELKLKAGSSGESIFALHGQDALIGRADHCDIVVDEPTVSSRHGVLKACASGYTFTDLGSRNGSAIARGAEVMAIAPGEETPLAPGDVLLLGTRDDPVRLTLAVGGAAPFSAALSRARTVIATTPLADLRAPGSDALLALAAEVAMAEAVEDLAPAALRWLRSASAGTSQVAVHLAGAGFDVRAGAPWPSALAALARDASKVVALAHPGEGIAQAVVAPLAVGGAWHGALAAWTSTAVPGLPESASGAMAQAATLVGLAVSGLALRGLSAAERARLVQALRARAGEVDDPIGCHPLFVKALALCRDLAPSDVPVLLVGETGVGKEVLARALHAHGPRAEAPFVAMNCAAIPDTLIESELFGHTRGAFTGALAERRGVFEQADQGTLFLDEIGEMPLRMQAKLLRVLEDGEVRRVGAERAIRVDVRVVSATHRDLMAEAEAGEFRRDLLYRLNTVAIAVPALRERGDDVLILAHRFLAERCRAEGDKRIAGFSPEALRALTQHDWPGNVRELKNEVARAVALTGSGHFIEAASFSEVVRARVGCTETGSPWTLKAQVERAERVAVEQAMAREGGNMTRVAEILGLSRTGLYKLMVRLGIARD